jgi:hypothetical protein
VLFYPKGLKKKCTSILIGLLTVLVKLGLSILIINSAGSKNGFLKSIAALPPAILKGPLGCGAELTPINRQLYSPPSSELIIS